MTTNNNKHIITNEVVWRKQSFFAYATLLSFSMVSFVFNISSSHSNTNLPIRRFSQKQFLIFNF